MAILNPSHSNADVLINCLRDALGQLGIDLRRKDSVLKGEDMPGLVGGGTDEASVNVGVLMKTQLQATLSWLLWTWCFPPPTQVAYPDAFQSSLFTEINEMLL